MPESVTNRNNTPEGDPYREGLQRGQAAAREIRAILRRTADRYLTTSLPDEPPASEPQELERRFTAAQLAEMNGLADGAGVHLANILAYNVACGDGELAHEGTVEPNDRGRCRDGTRQRFLARGYIPPRAARRLSTAANVRLASAAIVRGRGDPGR